MKIIALVLPFLFSVPMISPALCAEAASPTLDRGFADLVKKVGPGVVNISTFARSRQAPGQGMDPQGELFRKFFEQFFGGRMGPQGPGGGPNGGQDPRGGFGGGPNGDGGDEGDGDDEGPIPHNGALVDPHGKVQPLALGTGFIIDAAEGLIVTNYHVVEDSEEVKIQIAEDDDLIPCEVIGRDPELDVALLKVKVKTKLSSIALGDSDKIDVGEYVIAIGNPLGYGHTVSHGILSAKGRRNPEFRLGRYLQTDASINPGNSGGPLVNMRGEVIGINNAIDARGQGIGFAIPINLIKAVLPQLKTKGQVSRGFIGVSAGELTPEVAEQLHIDPKVKGVLVADVAKNLPADKAGIKPYDIILSVNGEKLTNSQDLTLKVTTIPVGSTAEVTLLRNGKEKKVKVLIAERPIAGVLPAKNEPSPGTKSAKVGHVEDFGLSLEEVNDTNAARFGIPASALKGKKLIAVSGLTPDKPAADGGLNQGDVILDVAGKEIHSVSEAVNAFKIGKGKSILVRVKRFAQGGGDEVNVVVLTK
jgi:serine protease Do